MPAKLLKRTTSAFTEESFKFLMDRNLTFKIISTFKTSKYVGYFCIYSKAVKFHHEKFSVKQSKTANSTAKKLWFSKTVSVIDIKDSISILRAERNYKKNNNELKLFLIICFH